MNAVKAGGGVCCRALAATAQQAKMIQAHLGERVPPHLLAANLFNEMSQIFRPLVTEL
jgi:hypothetical protein